MEKLSFLSTLKSALSWKSRPNGNRRCNIFASISTEGNICTNICPRTDYLLLEAYSFLRMFLRQIEDSLFIILHIILQRTGKMFTNNLPFIAWDVHFSVFYGRTLLRWTIKLVPFSATTTKRSYLELNFEQILLSKWT